MPCRCDKPVRLPEMDFVKLCRQVACQIHPFDIGIQFR